jgi:hypothetical protein
MLRVEVIWENNIELILKEIVCQGETELTARFSISAVRHLDYTARGFLAVLLQEQKIVNFMS